MENVRVAIVQGSYRDCQVEKGLIRVLKRVNLSVYFYYCLIAIVFIILRLYFYYSYLIII
jgi:hypothetical protein